MSDQSPKLQRASSQDGFSIEWVQEGGEPFFEIFRADDGGMRRVIFGATELALEEFQSLLDQSLGELDDWEMGQREMGFIDETGKRTV